MPGKRRPARAGVPNGSIANRERLNRHLERKMGKAGMARLRREQLQQSGLRHRHDFVACDDEMIEQPHVDKSQSLLQSLR